MTRRESNLTAAVVVLSVLLLMSVGASIGWHGITNDIWRTRYATDVRDVAELTAHYAKVRQETGQWPEPGEGYLMNMRYRASRKVSDQREDLWGSRHGPWVIFELKKDGTLQAHVRWDQPGEFEE